jgi:uncharacterized protein YjbI with pentapeptide repeats
MASMVGIPYDTLRMVSEGKSRIGSSKEGLDISDIGRDDIDSLAFVQSHMDSQVNDDLADGVPPAHVIEFPRMLDRYVVSIGDSGVRAEGIALLGKILFGINFKKSQLTDSYFCEVVFSRCDFTSCDLESSVFHNCIFNACTFDSANLMSSDFNRCRFYDTTFIKTNADLSQMGWCAFMDCQFTFFDMKVGKIISTSFGECSFDECNLRDTRFIIMSSINSTFSGVVFNDSRFLDCILMRTSIKNSDMTNVTASCITTSGLSVDKKWEALFDLKMDTYNLGLFEWKGK